MITKYYEISYFGFGFHRKSTYLYLGTETGQVSVWNSGGKLQQTWQAHASGGVNAVQMSPDFNFVLSGAAEVCIFSLSDKTAQLTCWNTSEVTSLEWIDEEKFLVAETSGTITLDRMYRSYFRKVKSKLLES